MIRPYIAVVKDSFREALSSRILWVLVLLITVLLAALAPLGFDEKFATTIHREEILDAPGILRKLEAEGRADKSTPAHRIWSLLPGDLRQDVAEAADILAETGPDDLRELSPRLREALNRLLTRHDVYDEVAWEGVFLTDEARAFVDGGIDDLSDAETARLNRLLFESAFPGRLAVSDGTAVSVQYFGFDLTEELPLGPDDVRPIIEQTLSVLLYWLVGVFGILAAILVTSPIIPRTFEAGEIDLLLSKPVSRSLLFLAKFFGGCAFVFLNVSYLLVGLWLIAGLRYEIWNTRILLCIPVFLFIFAIYYSISAVAGVVWKSAIMSVVLTIVAWAAFFTVGVGKESIEFFLLNPTRLTTIVPAGESLIVSNKAGETFEWDETRGDWRQIFRSARTQRPPRFVPQKHMIGPVYDRYKDQILAIDAMPTGPGHFALPSSGDKLLVGRHSDGWSQQSGADLPSNVHALFVDPQGNIVVAGPFGVYRFTGDPSAERKPFKIFGFDIAPKDVENQFVTVTPKDAQTWQTPFAAAMNPTDGSVAIFEAGSLLLLKLGTDGPYTIVAQRDLETEQPAVLAFAGDHVLAALGDGRLLMLQTPTLETVAVITPYPDQKPRTAHVSSDGRWFAVLFHDGRLWHYDVEARRGGEAPISGQGDVLAAAFTPVGELVVADQFRHVTAYQLDANGSWQPKRRFAPDSTTLELAYRYAVVPLYTVFPKPRELNNVVSYLLTDVKTASITGRDDDLQTEHVVMDVWTPVWTNLVFLMLILSATCVYLSRKDF